MATKPTMCSFFSGAGFFDYGFKEDFEIVWANELCPKAASSYRANVGNHMRVVNIEEIPLAEIPEADVYVGTPPCQDFSSDGANRGEDGDRGRLVWVFERIVAAKRPKAFVMENVVGSRPRWSIRPITGCRNIGNESSCLGFAPTSACFRWSSQNR